MANSSIKHGIAVVLVANLINLFFNLLTNFLLPKYLSINTYAQLKSFIMYTNYVGILHMGYSDGMYLNYGGRDIKTIPNEKLAIDIRTMRNFQIIVTIFFALIVCWRGDIVLLASALTIAPINMINYYKYLFQATGEFDNYSKILNISTIMTSVFLIGLLLRGVYKEIIFYLLIYVITDFVIWMYLEGVMLFKYDIHSILGFKLLYLNVLKNNIFSGFFLMLGTFSNIILTGMDRWFVKALLNEVDFALYSFAVSIEGLVNVVTAPIAVTLYNFFCIYSNNEKGITVKGKVILFSSSIVSVAFGAKFILERWLIEYTDANRVIFFLFASQIFFIVTKCLYANLYKSEKKQKKYFIKLTCVIVLGCIFNALLYQLMKNKDAFAIGTMLCGIIWLLISEKDFPMYRIKMKEKAFLIITCTIFLWLGIYSISYIGGIAYIVIVITLANIMMHDDFLSCIEEARKVAKKIIYHIKN